MTILSKAAFFRLATVFFTAICFLQISALADPPDYKKMSEDEIQKMLLKDVPLGSSSDAVRAYLKAKTGADPAIETDISYYVTNPSGESVQRHFDRVAEAEIGSYRYFIVFIVYVDTYWEFDDHLRLVKLTVSKRGGEMP